MAKNNQPEEKIDFRLAHRTEARKKDAERLKNFILSKAFCQGSNFLKLNLKLKNFFTFPKNFENMNPKKPFQLTSLRQTNSR